MKFQKGFRFKHEKKKQGRTVCEIALPGREKVDSFGKVSHLN